MMTPTVSRMVHYVDPVYGCVAAVIVRVGPDQTTTLLPLWPEGGAGLPIPDVKQSDVKKEPRTWHEPERV